MYLTIHCVTCEYGNNLKFDHLTTLYMVLFLRANLGRTHHVLLLIEAKKGYKTPFRSLVSFSLAALLYTSPT